MQYRYVCLDARWRCSAGHSVARLGRLSDLASFARYPSVVCTEGALSFSVREHHLARSFLFWLLGLHDDAALVRVFDREWRSHGHLKSLSLGGTVSLNRMRKFLGSETVTR